MHPYTLNWGIAFAAMLWTFLMGGCSDAPKDPHGTITVGTNYWTGYEPLHYAADEHLYEGDVKTRLYDSTNTVLNDFRSGRLQAAALTLDEVMILKDQGFDPLIIAVLDISQGGDCIVARPSIGSVSMLKNKNIAVESGALGSYVISRALELNGIKRHEVMILPINALNSAQAYKSGIVDAVVTYEPLRGELIGMGAHEIFNSKEIPNEIVDVLVINRSYASPETVRILLEGWGKGVEAIHRNDTEAIGHMARHLKSTPSDFNLALSGLKIPSRAESDGLIRNGTLAQTIRNVQKMMLDYQLIHQPFEPRTVLPDPKGIP